MDALQLLHRVADRWHQAPSDDATARRIVAAAAKQLELFGIQRTTMEDVARRAGVSRVTVYRHFDAKDALVEAVVLAEARQFLDELGAFLDAYGSDEERIVEGFAFVATNLREHQLLQRLLEREPELFLPQLTTGAAPLIAVARQMIVAWARTRLDRVPPEDLEVAAEVGVRMVLSLILTPEGVIDLADPDRLRDLARRVLPYALGGRAALRPRPRS